MEHLNSIRAALRANGTAPVLAIPIEGHAPICVRAKLLKGALKGVTIDSVKILPNRWLQITGTAKGKGLPVHTCSKFAPMERSTALRMIWDWSEKEHKRRIKVINQGVLSAKEQRALKLKAAEKAGIAELIQAQKEEAEILANARASLFPVITPLDAEDRAEVIAEYSAFRKSLPNRKRGAVIRWKLAKLRKQVKDMTKTVNIYGEWQPGRTPYSRRHRVLKGSKIELRRQKDKVLYAALLYQIGKLEKQYKALYPSVWHSYSFCDEVEGDRGYWIDPWIAKRPTKQSYRVPYSWEHGTDDEETTVARLKRMAETLKDARANIRALTPPEDEQEKLSRAA